MALDGALEGARAFVQSLRAGGAVELEVRLGTAGPTSFDPTITKDQMHRLLKCLGASADRDTLEWRESHDFFYVHDDRVVRTSVDFNDRDFTMEPTHVVKRRLGGVDRARYRVAWASETPVAADELPFATEVKHVRIKQRRSLDVCIPEATHPVWRYDFTMVWAGGNKEEAEIAARTTAPRYEMEVEVLAGGVHELVARARDGAGGVAAAEAVVVCYLATRLEEIGEGLSGMMD